jgi:porin
MAAAARASAGAVPLLVLSIAASAEAARWSLEATYTGEGWSNLEGGRRRGERYLELAELALGSTGDAALGVAGLSLFGRVQYINGAGVSADLLGDTQTASNIEGHQGLRVFELWAQWSASDPETASVRFGLYDLASEFDSAPSGALFLHSSQGTGADIAQTGLNGPSIFPTTGLSVRADLGLAEEWRLRGAILDGVPGDLQRPRRTIIRLDAREGALLIAELARDTQAAGKFALGVWHYTARFDDLTRRNTDGRAVRRRDNRGIYALLDRPLSSMDESGRPRWSGYLRAGLANSAINAYGSYFGAGLILSPIASPQRNDQLGISVAHARFGSPYRRAALAGSAETALELTWRWPVNEWLTVQPDLQYIINPGSDSSLRDAIAVGLRFEVAARREW